jgi:hypothetical protein
MISSELCLNEYQWISKNILFINKLRQIIAEVRSKMLDLLIFIFILKTTGTFTPVHSAGYLLLRNIVEHPLDPACALICTHS